VDFRSEVREFLTTQIPADIRSRWLAGAPRMPDDVVAAQRILNEYGLAVPHWPIEWGGKNWTSEQSMIWSEEMQLASVPEPLAFNTSMVGPVIAQFGSDELKARFLPATANLDIWWCQGFSEPEAGSDLASLRTTAVRDGDAYVINGQKTWTTLGQFADWIFVLARTDQVAAKPQAGISFLLVDMKTPGVTVRPIELIDGSHEVNEVFFDDVRIPATQLVGEENRGWSYAKFLLNHERSAMARIGDIKVALAQSKRFAAERGSGGGRLIDDALFSARLAEAENDVLALHITQLRVGGSEAEGQANPAASILKLRGSQLWQVATELGMEVGGQSSLEVVSDDSPLLRDWSQRIAQRYLNGRKVSIFGGSNEIQRNIIAALVLGL
jgi:alkylation response protein AidB-like acyl-CoA dehydrogenase